MPFFSGLAQGFNDALTQNRQFEAQQAELQAQRDTSTLTLIAQQHEDPEVRARALDALMQGVKAKPDKGWKGIFGGWQGSPALPAIRQLMGSGKSVTAEPATMGTNVAPGSMAQPGQALTEPGAATPPPSATASLGMPGSLPNQDRPATMATVPRGGLMLPGEAEARGKITGTFGALDTGSGGGMTSGDREIIGLRMLGVQPHYVQDSQGNLRAFVGTQEIGPPATGVGRTSGGFAQVEAQAQNLFQSGLFPSIDEARVAAHRAAAQQTAAQQTTAGNRAVITGTQAAVAPQMAQDRMLALRQRVLNEQAALPGIQMSNELKQRTLNGQLTQVEASRIAATLLQNRPGATSDDFNEMVGALTGGTAGSTPTVSPAATAPPAAGTPEVTPNAAVAPPTASAAPAVVAGGAPPRTTAAPTGVTPVAAAAGTPAAAPKAGLPPGRSLYKPNAEEQKALDVITSARPMMQRAQELINKIGADNNTMAGKIKGMKNTLESRFGFNPSDPNYQELLPLLNHIRVYALSPYLHGIRAGAFVGQLQENSPEDADTPALMSRKLTNLEQNFQNIEAGIGATRPGTASATKPPGGGNAASQPGPEWSHDAQGRLLYNGKPF